MQITNAVVPVAGMGTRLLPATKSQPKEMLPVGKRPVVQYVVDELRRNGLRQVLLITGSGKHSIENHFDVDPVLIRFLRETNKEALLKELDFERQDMRYFYTRQKMQLGLGDAILHAAEFTGNKPFVVALGDSIIGRHAQSRTLSKMMEIFTSGTAEAVIAFEEVPEEEVHHYGIAEPETMPKDGEKFVIRDLIEKPSKDEAPSRLAVAARYVFSQRIYEALRETKPGKGGEIQLTDAIRLLIRGGERVVGVKLPPDEARYDIGNHESYFQAFIDFALHDPEYGERMRAFCRELLNENH
ncbi:UTP--glucose-1-phosphate uridylyltransferase [Candidatus Sumerlaeota bacterium]|nr:UTP--glucose-1-phosphate uridylyltransferase [Candidatus Sumerlaeota bacterium]